MTPPVGASPPPPRAATLHAPAGWQAIDFISDLHLARSEPATFDAWRKFLAHTDADAVFMLGDVFDLWVGDDACDEPGSFEADCAAVLAAATPRVFVAFMAGNRDFLVGPSMLARCGVAGLDDPTLLEAFGHRVLLTHGDALCLADTGYQRLRRQVRDPVFQSSFLARPLAERRQFARGLRDASEQHKQTNPREVWADIDPDAALAWLDAAGSRELLHGHTHRPGRGPIAPGYVRHVLSDWHLEAEPPRAEVLRLTRDGFGRRPPW